MSNRVVPLSVCWTLIEAKGKVVSLSIFALLIEFSLHLLWSVNVHNSYNVSIKVYGWLNPSCMWHYGIVSSLCVVNVALLCMLFAQVKYSYSHWCTQGGAQGARAPPSEKNTQAVNNRTLSLRIQYHNPNGRAICTMIDTMRVEHRLLGLSTLCYFSCLLFYSSILLILTYYSHTTSRLFSWIY